MLFIIKNKKKKRKKKKKNKNKNIMFLNFFFSMNAMHNETK